MIKNFNTFFIFVTGVANPCIQIMFAIAYKNAINAIEYNNQTLFGRTCFLVIVSIIIQCIIEPIANCYNGCLVNRIVCHIKETVFQHIEKLPLSYFENNHSGDTMARLTSDIEKFDPIYRGNIRNLMQSIIYGISAVVCMFILSYKITICSILFSTIIFFSNAAFTNISRKLGEKNQKQVSKVTQGFINIYNGCSTANMFVSIGGFLASLQVNLASASRIFEVLDTKLENSRYEISGADNAENDEMIVYENICFSYNDEKNVLNNINLSMKKNNVPELFTKVNSMNIFVKKLIEFTFVYFWGVKILF
jgi:ABC-type multidrug transport system fused ATPase/permease subunit